MWQGCSIKTKITPRLILCSGALFLAGGVLSLAMQAKICQYLSPKTSCSLFSFKATKIDNERFSVAEELEAEDFVSCPFVSNCPGVVSSSQPDVNWNIAVFLPSYSLRSPPA
jgi:hypothetical protein